MNDFLENILAQLDHPDSVAFLTFLLLAFLIGFITGWVLYGGRARRRKRELKKLEFELKAAQARATGLQEQLDLKMVDFVKAERQTEEALLKARELEAEKEKLELALADAKKEIERLEAAARSYNHTIEDLNNQILGLKTRQNKLLQEMERGEEAVDLLADMQSSYNATLQRLQAVEERLDRLSAENEALKAALQLGKKGAADAGGSSAPESPAPLALASSEEVQKAAEKFRQLIGKSLPAATVKDKDDLTLIKGIGRFIEQKLNDLGIYSYAQVARLDDAAIELLTKAIEFFPGRIKRDDWVGQAARLQAIKEENPDALNPAAVFPNNPTDLKVIEGIGPKIEALLKKNGIGDWKTLSETEVEKLYEILEKGGERFRMHDPSTWPLQAELAANGEWDKLKQYQEHLIGGREKG
ncbi:MAG: DUF1049 domain-containing protein [Bacteroidetes bacterium]|nr:MAG: DUF1049 domain-containing protein [Bacteroidota bacterium]